MRLENGYLVWFGFYNTHFGYFFSVTFGGKDHISIPHFPYRPALVYFYKSSERELRGYVK